MEEKLIGYNKLIADIKEIKWKIKKIENREARASGGVLDVTGVRPQGFKSSAVENEVVEKVDSIEKLRRELAEKEAEKEYIEAKLNLLTPLERRVIELKYFKNLSDEGIQKTVDRNAQSTISRIIKRSLKKMQ